MSKVLISFLGAGNYTPCKYRINEQESPVVTYVQQAMTEIFCQDWIEDDRVLVLLTEAARQKNWESHLATQMPDHITIQTVDIPDGLSEEQIWQIFSLVFERLREGEEVIYDITYGFRSLPMLGITLLNYSKFLKNISVQGIYYGAYDARDKDKNIAPILDLTSFSTLQDWSTAASQFLHYGITDALKSLAEKEYVPLLSQTLGKHETASQLRNLAQALEKFSSSVQTSNGPEIISGEQIGNIRKNLNQDYKSMVPAFQPLLDHISRALADFDDRENIMNGFKAVEWCIKNNLIQQGFTLLQENTITYVAAQHQKDYMDKQIREDISSAFKIVSQGINTELWSVNDNEFVNTLINSNSIYYLKKCFDAISQRRNELNHARFNVDPSGNIDYKTKLEELFTKVLNSLA